MIVSSGWGVLSTDSGNAYDWVGTYALDVSDTVAGTGQVEEVREGKEYFATREVGGVTYGYLPGGSGYVAYADSGVFDKFDNVRFYGGNEVQIMASSNSSAFYTNSELNSGHIGVMTQQNAGGTISVKDSVMNVGETGVQIKSGAANNGYTNVELVGTEVNFTSDAKWGGTLVELVESDDAGNPGNTSFTIDDRGDEATIATASGQVAASSAALSQGEYTGNIWNNIYNKYQELNVTLDNATLNGTVSSSYGYHIGDNGERIENGAVLEADTTGNYLKSGVTDYAIIGAQYNVAHEQVNNPVNVALTGNSTWKILLADGACGEADACYVQDLTAEAGTAITADAPVTVYYCGELSIDGASVSDNVTFVEFQRDVIEVAPAASTYTVTDYAFHTLTVNVVDEDGSPVKGAINFSSNVLAKGVYFNASAASGYQITGGLDGYDSDEAAYTYFIAMDGDTAITITVAAGSASGEASGGAS